MEIKALENKVLSLTKISSNLRERTLKKLNKQAKEQLKELQNDEKRLKLKKEQLEKTIYKIENIDEYLKGKKAEKNE